MRDYNDLEYKKFRRIVRARDGGCRWPGCRKKKKIQVHHIMRWADYPALRFLPNNGICLCKQHHNMTKGKEEVYASVFIRIISEKN